MLWDEHKKSCKDDWMGPFDVASHIGMSLFGGLYMNVLTSVSIPIS